MQFCFAHPGDQVAAIDIERSFQGLQLCIIVAGTAMRRSQVAQQSARMGVGCDRTFERFSRDLEIALAQRVHALAVGGCGLLYRL